MITKTIETIVKFIKKIILLIFSNYLENIFTFQKPISYFLIILAE